jgi:hypothetical protein
VIETTFAVTGNQLTKAGICDMRNILSVGLILVMVVTAGSSSGIAFGATHGAQAQEVGKLTGILKDTAGKPIVSATVSIDRASDVVVAMMTDVNGVFSARNVPVGAYSIAAVSASGVALPGAASINIFAGATTTVTLTSGVAGLTAETDRARFIGALTSTAGLATMGALGVAGVVGVFQWKKEASPSR